MTVQLMQGNQACVEGAIAAGCRFFAGYPITPSSEIAEWMARRLPPLDGVFIQFIQMEDEIASGVQRLTNDAAHDVMSVWLPTGNHIAWRSTQGGT